MIDVLGIFANDISLPLIRRINIFRHRIARANAMDEKRSADLVGARFDGMGMHIIRRDMLHHR